MQQKKPPEVIATHTHPSAKHTIGITKMLHPNETFSGNSVISRTAAPHFSGRKEFTQISSMASRVDVDAEENETIVSEFKSVACQNELLPIRGTVATTM